MNNKKAISAVVATVLIILITVAAVTIIWAAIIPMIKNKIGVGGACFDAVSQVSVDSTGYTCLKRVISSTSGTCSNSTTGCNASESVCKDAGGCAGTWTGDERTAVQVQISRDAKDFELADIQVGILIAGDTSTYKLVEDLGIAETSLPKQNEAKVYTIDAKDFQNATQVEVSPIVRVGNTKEPCDIAGSAALSLCSG